MFRDPKKLHVTASSGSTDNGVMLCFLSHTLPDLDDPNFNPNLFSSCKNVYYIGLRSKSARFARTSKFSFLERETLDMHKADFRMFSKFDEQIKILVI